MAWGRAGTPAAARRARPTRAAGRVQDRARAPPEQRLCQAGFRLDLPPWHFSCGAVLAACSFPGTPHPRRWHRPRPSGGPGCWCWAAPRQHPQQKVPRHPGSSPSPPLTPKLKVVSIASCFTTHFSLKQTISSHKKTMNIFLLLIIEGQLINWA